MLVTVYEENPRLPAFSITYHTFTVFGLDVSATHDTFTILETDDLDEHLFTDVSETHIFDVLKTHIFIQPEPDVSVTHIYTVPG